MFERILVPLDGSSLAECVLPHLVALARVFAPDITLLRVLEHSVAEGDSQFVNPLDWHLSEAQADAYLDRVRARLEAVNLRPETMILEGHAAETVVEHARSDDIDLILLSSHGRSGLSGWNISSVVQKIILRAYTSTMIVRAYEPVSDELAGLSYDRLLVAMDGSKRAEFALPMASSLARAYDGTLLVAHVVRKPEMPRRTPPTEEDIKLADRLTERNRETAEAYLDELRGRLPEKTEFHLAVSDSIPSALYRIVENEEVDLVILTAHGYTADPKWPYGSVATNFIAYGTTPLLIVQDIEPEEVEPSKAEVAAKEHKGH